MQIVSSDWVEASTTRGAYKADEWPTDPAESGASNYKYQWWLLSEENGDYSTLGKDGQYMYVNPEKNLIIIRLGETTGDSPWFQVFQEIAQGIR
jgi:CubicO group peptidase (beta-lactamase class C family)